MRTLIIFWVAGLIEDDVMERWRRHGGRYVPVEDVLVGMDVVATEPDPGPLTARPSWFALVITGAKLDAERIRRRATAVPLGVPMSRRRRPRRGLDQLNIIPCRGRDRMGGPQGRAIPGRSDLVERPPRWRQPRPPPRRLTRDLRPGCQGASSGVEHRQPAARRGVCSRPPPGRRGTPRPGW